MAEGHLLGLKAPSSRSEHAACRAEKMRARSARFFSFRIMAAVAHFKAALMLFEVRSLLEVLGYMYTTGGYVEWIGERGICSTNTSNRDTTK